MRYKYFVVGIDVMQEVARRANVMVGESVVEHFINSRGEGWKLASMCVENHPKMALYHFVFEVPQ